MSIVFPTTLDDFTNPTSDQTLVAAGGNGVAGQLSDINDAIEALEAKLGVNSSAVATSFDYLLKNTSAGHDHDGTDSKKVIVTNINVTGIAANKMVRVNSGATALEAFSGDFDLSGTTDNILVNAVDPKRGFYIPVSSMYPSLTAGCSALTQVESTTNKVNVYVLDFDGAGTSKEFAEFGVPSPTYWDAGTVTVKFVWLASAGSGTVNWEIQGGAFSNDDALDAAYGTLKEVTDTVIATGDVHISDETSPVTIAGTPVAGDWLMFRVARDPANDTDTSDARLLGIIIKFGIGQYNDA